MIISRTTLRMSFVGGGSDLPSYYRHHGGGAVVSTAINKYVYITVNDKFDDSIRVSYSKTEEVSSVADIQHEIVRETMFYLGIKGGVEITSEVADSHQSVILEQVTNGIAVRMSVLYWLTGSPVMTEQKAKALPSESEQLL